MTSEHEIVQSMTDAQQSELEHIRFELVRDVDVLEALLRQCQEATGHPLANGLARTQAEHILQIGYAAGIERGRVLEALAIERALAARDKADTARTRPYQLALLGFLLVVGVLVPLVLSLLADRV